MQKAYLKKDTGKKFNYLLSTPDNYDKSKESLPLIIFLHGAGERGEDPWVINRNGIAFLFDKESPVRAVTLSPQCAEGKIWITQVYDLKELIDDIVEEYNIDKKRITITGLSLGGFGTWMMGYTFPDFFAAMAPVCGGGISFGSEVLKDVPIRAFHGSADDVVPLVYSTLMVDHIRDHGGRAELVIYHGFGHDSWTNAYEDSDLVYWLYKQSK